MARLERIDYGTTYKYYPNSYLALGTSATRHQTGGKQEFSLLNLNPHRHALGLQTEDFTASRLCAPLVSSAAAEAVDGYTAAAAADHQLLDSKTPAVSTAAGGTDGDTAADDAVEDDPAGGDQPGNTKPSKAAAAAAPPDIQFILDDSTSGSESDEEENSGSELQSEDQQLGPSGNQAVDNPPEGLLIQPAATSAPQQQQQQQQQRERKRKRSSQEDAMMIHGSSSGGSSGAGGGSSGSESDTEGESGVEILEDDQAAAAAAAAAEESTEVDFLPLLPLRAAAAADEQASDHSDHPSDHDEGPNIGRSDRTPGYKPPWLPRLARFSSPMLRLHNEIVAFTKMLEPTQEEIDSRAKSMTVIREVVNSIWPHAEVLVFGSYETGLYTPASDTDVVVVNAGLNNPTTGLKALAHALTQRQLVRNMQQVLTARVPIIKFEMIESGLAFDVAWEQRTGPEGAKVVRNLLAQWPVMKPLVLVLKVFLTQRELNEVYSGGIGSYSLIIMVAAFLQLHPSRRPKEPSAGAGSKRGRSSSMGGVPVANAIEANLGLLLIDFFRLYGRALNLSEVGATCASDGSFYSKAAKGFNIHDRPWLLSIQDPLDPLNDTARNSWNIKLVRQVFDHAYQLLTAPCSPSESLLGRIIHLAPVVSGRPTPAWFYEAPKAPLGSSHRGERYPRTPSGHRDHKDRDRSGFKSPGGSSSKGFGSSSGKRSDRGDRYKHNGDSKGRKGDRRHKEREYSRGREKGREKGRENKRRISNDFAAAAAGGVRLDRGRDAAGRAGAAVGGGRYQQQQQQQGYRESPSRKKQRR